MTMTLMRTRLCGGGEHNNQPDDTMMMTMTITTMTMTATATTAKRFKNLLINAGFKTEHNHGGGKQAQSAGV